MTEDQKYQGSLYKNKKVKIAESDTEPKDMPQPAYVEEDYEWRDYEDSDEEEEDDDDDLSPTEPLPEAPTPPAADDALLNVFDYLDPNATPTASNVSLHQSRTAHVKLSKDTQLVRFDYEANAYVDPLGHMVDEDAMVQYGTGPIPGANPRTPANKTTKKKTKDGDKDVKKDKKRKRLHVDTHDQIMTDAPPVLHSGLTGGLSKLMTRPAVFPPSPDYSGGDAAETPASPLKKSRHSKTGKASRVEAIGNSLMAIISTGSTKTKTKTKTKRRHTSSTKKTSHRARIEGKDTKLIEYHKDEDGNDKAMVLFKPRAEHFLSFVNKGPESERGCSMNKALKRYHRERVDQGNNNLSKLMEEKELWRSLRLKKNDRGEIVLFCVDDD
jgi:cell growth-regulating nucleolar protein